MNDDLAVLDEQRRLWSTAPRDWAELAEPENLPLYERMLDVTDVGAGTRCSMSAAARDCSANSRRAAGAQVTGIDACPELLEIARERTPGADLRDGDLGLCLSSPELRCRRRRQRIQFAPDPAAGLAEVVRRAAVPVDAWSPPLRRARAQRGHHLHLAMKELVEQVEGKEDGYAPYALSSPGARTGGDGRRPSVRECHELPCVDYADRDTTLRALLCSAGGARAAAPPGTIRSWRR